MAGEKSASPCRAGAHALIWLRLNPSSYLLIWIWWLKENSEAGDNGCIFCRTSWFIQIICTRAGREANCTWTICLSLPRSAAEVYLLTSAKGGCNGVLRKIYIHSCSSQERCLGVNLWGFYINAIMIKKLRFLSVRSPGSQVFVCWKACENKNKHLSVLSNIAQAARSGLVSSPDFILRIKYSWWTENEPINKQTTFWEMQNRQGNKMYSNEIFITLHFMDLKH